MNKLLAIASTLLAGSALAACSSGHAPHAQDDTASQSPAWATSAGSEVGRALDQASADLATKDITLTARDTQGKFVPDAKITPAGDLVIDGKPVALTPAEQTAVLAYRKQLVVVAQQGIAIGGQGAQLGITAAGDALAAIFSGQSRQELHTRLAARATGIKDAATKLCSALPALRTSQQKLAVEVPAFAPYASLTAEDVTNCHQDGTHPSGGHP